MLMLDSLPQACEMASGSSGICFSSENTARISRDFPETPISITIHLVVDRLGKHDDATHGISLQHHRRESCNRVSVNFIKIPATDFEKIPSTNLKNKYIRDAGEYCGKSLHRVRWGKNVFFCWFLVDWIVVPDSLF